MCETPNDFWAQLTPLIKTQKLRFFFRDGTPQKNHELIKAIYTPVYITNEILGHMGCNQKDLLIIERKVDFD